MTLEANRNSFSFLAPKMCYLVMVSCVLPAWNQCAQNTVYKNLFAQTVRKCNGLVSLSEKSYKRYNHMHKQCWRHAQQ